MCALSFSFVFRITGLKKKPAEACELLSFRKVGKWLWSITSKLYWTVSSNGPGCKERGEKWCSFKHLWRNVHSHPGNEIFKHCEHSPLQKEFIVDGKVHIRDWFMLLTQYQSPIQGAVQRCQMCNASYQLSYAVIAFLT